MNSGIAVTGTDTSCDATAPIRRLASGIISLIRQNSAACFSDRAATPSATRPESIPSAAACSSIPAMPQSDSAAASARTVQSGILSNGSRVSGKASARNSSPVPLISSKADSRLPKRSRNSESRETAAAGSLTARTAAAESRSRGKIFRLAAVISPNVPSDPISSCFRSYPALSFLSEDIPFQIPPSGSTASTPRQSSRMLPWRRTWIPPAFVARLPPIWLLPRAAIDNGNSRPALSAADRTDSSVHPAPAASTFSSASTLSIRSIRSVERMTGAGMPMPIWPPTSPVPPPNGTTGIRCSQQCRMTRDASAAPDGASTMPPAAECLFRGSERYFPFAVLNAADGSAFASGSSASIEAGRNRPIAASAASRPGRTEPAQARSAIAPAPGRCRGCEAAAQVR